MTVTPEQLEAAAGGAQVLGEAAGVGGAVATGAAVGAAVGTVVPGIGNVVGGAVGALAGLVVGGISLAVRAEKLRKSRKLRIGKGDVQALFAELDHGVLFEFGTVSAAIRDAKDAGKEIVVTHRARRELERQRGMR